MKFFKKLLSATLAASMIFASFTVNTTVVSAAPSISAGWNESLYAEWADSNPDSPNVVVGYKLSTDANYTYLSGDDLTYLVRPASTRGYGRVDIPGLKAGRYDLYIKASDGTVHTRTGIKVYEYDRSGYAHWTAEGGAESYDGVGAYNNDGTLKDNAIVIYLTDENKDTVEVPGYEGTVWNYTPSSGSPYSRTSEGIGNILNNNMKFIQQVTITDNHPLVVRVIGTVNVPKNLTPYDTKDPILGGSENDNGNLAITKYGRNITIEGIGDDATIDGWGFTFSQTSTCPKEAGKNFEVRNLTFKNYAEDGLGFQGDDAVTCPIQRIWVHNNVFYPGYCANPAESDKAEGDGSCDFKRGQYYTMSYNHYINCHKTNLVGAGDANNQFYVTLHHNWYENVASRQPLAAGGNIHIYNTYFQDTLKNGKDHYTSQVIDLRGKAECFSEANYFDNCKNAYQSRKATSNIKTFNDYLGASTIDSIAGTMTVATTRDQAGLPDNGLAMPDGGSIANFDTNTKYFYYDAVNKVSDVSVLNDVMDVPEYVTTYAGTLHAFPETESGEISITVKYNNAAVNDASVTANGLTFKNQGNGVYTATASLGSEYVITVSKEGYSNVVINSDVLNNDGDTFNATANLQVDYDGYAVVKLTGGSDNAAVKGASVKLNNGTVLVEQGDGVYKSASQIATGNYTATITNTGDYVAPATAQAVVVKTTDAATEIHLDKIKGAVSVTLSAAADETEPFDATSATVYVGTTVLTNAGNGVFTGEVEVNTPFDVYVNLPGWKVDSITPAQLTAAKEGTASAEAVMRYKGQLFTWNYTEGINTEDFFSVSANDWNSASSHPQTYDGESLTMAVKMETATAISFTAPTDGDLALVLYRSSAPYIMLDGVKVECNTGTTIIPITAGDHTIAKGSASTYLYLMQFASGGLSDNPTPPAPVVTTTETTTETTTIETTTETTTYSIPVDLGDAVSNSGESGITVTYNAATDSWELKDTSSTLAATLSLPIAEPITSGKVVISGTATPTKASGTWAFVSLKDSAGAEVAALATDSSKNVTLRVNGDKDNGYSNSTDAIVANKTYNYTFVIDLDAKTVSLDVDGQNYVNSVPITATEIASFDAITAVSDTSRNLTVSVPYVGILSDAPAPVGGLNDEIMWDVTVDLEEGSNGLTVGETFYSNSEEDGPVEFVDGDNTYALSDWLQPLGNPYAEDGFNPMNPGNTGIPVRGGFAKFTPEKDGVFTMAVKTNGGKITYVTDENGAVVTKIDRTGLSTSYDVVRFNVKAGKSYHIFAGASKTCLYYLGYTSGISVPDEPTTDEPTTEPTTNEPTTDEPTTEPTTGEPTTDEPTTEPTTTDVPDPTPVKVYGDADADGDVDVVDVALTLQHVLSGVPFANDFEYVDVDKSGKIDTTDVAMILQYVLDKSYALPRE